MQQTNLVPINTGDPVKTMHKTASEAVVSCEAEIYKQLKLRKWIFQHHALKRPIYLLYRKYDQIIVIEKGDQKCATKKCGEMIINGALKS